MKIGFFSGTKSELALVSTNKREEVYRNFKNLETKRGKVDDRKVKRIKKAHKGGQTLTASTGTVWCFSSGKNHSQWYFSSPLHCRVKV